MLYGIFILKWFFRDNKIKFYLFVFNKIVCFGIWKIDVFGAFSSGCPLTVHFLSALTNRIILYGNGEKRCLCKYTMRRQNKTAHITQG